MRDDVHLSSCSRNFTYDKVAKVAKAEREDPLFGLPPLSGTRSYRVASDRRVLMLGGHLEL
jgi:hypothetical protein